MFLTIERETYKAGDVIFKEGSHGTAVYLLGAGKVEISKTVQDRKIVVEILGPGDIFGEMSYIDHSPRWATAIALEDTVLELIDKNFLDKEFNQIDSDFREIITTLVRRLRKTTQRLVSLPRRIGKRVSGKINISFKKADDFFKSYIANFGQGGLFIHTTKNLPVGSLLDLEFNLPDSNQEITTKGKVMWIRPQDMSTEKMPPGMGIQF
ncbi:MAG: cyclic nucleotide-binding domain-containing protein, partial [Deltaproteobacteria bacterium]|nr:cyclic nucleotide-binding domain-containing protein [Deltaproteobacteria bacterium]MBW2333056.1 cyclic nucleotide-binding domain-containing protein [Deltaproteobacteria bacterium]